MGKTKDWIIEANGENYNVSVEFHNFTGKHVIYLNSVSQDYKSSFIDKLVGFQQRIAIPEKTVIVEIRGNKAFCAVDGKYLDNGKAFKEIPEVPSWTWFFIIASFAIPVVSLGGAIPAIIGVFGAIYATKVSILTNNTLTNMGLSLLVTLSAWGLFFLFINFFEDILASA